MTFSELPDHHAVLITPGERAEFSDALWKELSHLSPANRYFNKTVLDIDTAREIISWAQSSYGGERIALISFHSAGIPAQNAMLKILEEPKLGTRFILVTTHRKNLIGTILSRVRHSVFSEGERGGEEHAEAFLTAAPSVRMKLPFVTELLSRVDEEGRKDREAVKSFILSLVEAGHRKRVDQRYLLETLECSSYAADPSSSGKALLEYLSLLLPQTAK